MVELEQRDLKIHLRWFRRDLPEADLIAVHFEGRPPVEQLEVDGETWQVRRAVSELALRSILVEDDRGPTLVLTPLRNRQLEDDLKARLGGMAIYNVDIWQRLAILFQATGVDARLKGEDHSDGIARTLLRVSQGGFAPVSAGFLDEKTAWKTIQRHALDQQSPAEELSDWLAWAVSSKQGVVQLFEVHRELVAALRDRLGKLYGATGAYFVDLLEKSADEEGAGQAGVAVMATGLALDAAFRAEEKGHVKPAAWVQKGLTAQGLDDEGRRFAGQTRRAWELLGETEQDAPVRQAVRSKVDELIREHGGEDYRAVASCSSVSETGWRERARAVVEAIDEMLESGQDGADQVRQRLDEMKEHSRAKLRPKRVEQLELMAALGYRLVIDGEQPEGLTGLGEHYVRDGSFIDAARETLTSADVGETAAPVQSKLIRRALERSEALNSTFSELLADELDSRTSVRQGLGVQEVIGEVIAPIAEDHPVLMVVLDGLNWAVARRLLGDDAIQRWEQWAPADNERFQPMYATIPSETKHSRTSLLTGKLQPGSQRVERDQFSRAVRDAGGVKRLKDAALFHKKEVDAAGPGQVGDEVRQAILDTQRRVVGVVVNAIDDQLSGADQLAVDWSVDAVTPLRTLLELAKHRVVVLVGDHGHVWETDTDYTRVGGESARWRAMSNERIEGERVFSGPMISELTGESEILTAWSERVRYTRGSAGYHGGASMQEILTPLVVLTREGAEVDVPGCRALNTRPSWWELREPPKEAELGDTAAESSPQLSLMEPDEPSVDTEWIERLVETETFQWQFERHGAGVTEELIARMLAQLHANDDKLSVEELADLVDLPVRRLERRLVVVTDVVNREGYVAVRFNRVEQLVELDRPMLERQFEL